MKPTIWFSRILRVWFCAFLTYPIDGVSGKGETPAEAYSAWFAKRVPVESLGREHA